MSSPRREHGFWRRQRLSCCSYEVTVIDAALARRETPVNAARDDRRAAARDAASNRTDTSDCIKDRQDFPTGVSYFALSHSTFVQPQKLDARISIPVEAAAFRMRCRHNEVWRAAV
ncbi:hypothetical protein BN2475_180017 [Paraburkholderia ribeironis]|uniref:Uncharacterized protein n=1 Tax=Paraburkholderia ribeironis TaxID=1247936 RepID=A0A1N7RUW1_9BURK|nr:hypothetical protein BN2475_180017 [Paraburkholderia ribeironis]